MLENMFLSHTGFPLLEAGLFAIMVGIAFVFMMVSFKFGALFKVFAGIMFLTVGVVLMAGYDIGFTTETTSGNKTITDIRYIVHGEGEWLAWIFIGLGVFNCFLFVIEMIPSSGR
jgi:hypothetical protein